MKYFIFLTALILIISCSGTPKTNEELPDLPLPAETAEDAPVSSQIPAIEDTPIEDTLIENILIEDDFMFASENETHEQEPLEVDISDLHVEEFFESEKKPEPDYIAEVLTDDDVISAAETAEQEPVVQEEPVTEQSVQEQSVQEQVQMLAETPPVQTQQPERQPQPQTQTQPPVQQQPQTQPEQQQVQTQPAPSVLAEEDEVIEQEEPSRTEQSRVPSFVPPFREMNPSPAQSVIVPANEDIRFSRIVYASVGQMIEIPFRGTGWVYLGELAAKRGIVYNSRRLDPEGMNFLFIAEAAGSYALKFFKQDFIFDYVLNDHVQIIIEEAPETAGPGRFSPYVDRGRVIAQPRWPSAAQEAEILRGGSRPGANTPPGTASAGEIIGTAPEQPFVTIAPPVGSTDSGQSAFDGRQQSANDQSSAGALSATQQSRQTEAASSASRETVSPAISAGQAAAGIAQAAESDSQAAVSTVQGTTSAGQTPLEAASELQSIPPELLLQRAKESFENGNTAAAIALLDQFREHYGGGTDELYWLYGQFYEANTPSRNILLSLDYYRRLVREYPQSSRFNDARARIVYLERFYINIR